MTRPLLSLFIIVTLLLGNPVWAGEKIVISSHTFTLPDGYSVKEIAASPLVERPIHMCFDNDGVMYVTDSSGNTDNAPAQLKNPTHRILRLVDSDGDGVFDESSVFAEKLPFPEGILWYEGAVYVGAPPHIWKFRDTDEDHVADEKTVWFDGGSIEGCGNDLHGPYLGMDGLFYWCKGAFAPQSHLLGSGKKFSSSAAHIYRARPDGSQLEVVITGGMNNPVGLAFGENGERFLSGTFFDLSKPGRRDGVLHAVYGGMYGKKHERVLSQHPHTGKLLPILTQMGPAAPSGIVMARHRALGMRGDLFCADFNLRRISRHRLTRSGSSFAAETSVFLESDQTEFHPADVIEDADGSLLVADTGSWYKICCPTSKVAKPESLGAIYRIEKSGIPALEDPRGTRLDWANPLIDWLADERPSVVRRAIDVLAKAENAAALQRAPAKIPALWSLHRIPGEEARAAVRSLLSGKENDEVREAAIHSISLWRDAGALESLQVILSKGSPQQRRLAAMALGRIGDVSATESLLRAGAQPLDDPFLRHAIVYALYELGGDVALPDSHLLTQQVRQMHEVDQRHPSPFLMPEIQLADEIKPDPAQEAQRKKRLDELMAFLPKGDAKRGEALFKNVGKSMCITCHVKGELGLDFGPDLTSVGAIRSGRDLLEAIVFPSATIARYYEMVMIEKRDGESAAGLLRRDTANELFLGAAPGNETAIPFRDIKSAKYSHLSLMPQVFDGLMKPEEIADMVAFLKEAKGPAEAQSAAAENELPPHHEIRLPGLHAYAQKSIAAGEEIEFRVSSAVPYDLSIVKLGPDPESREADPVLKKMPVDQPQLQPIHPGSYVHIEKGLPSSRSLSQLTLECWIRPFRLSGWQGLVTQHDYPDSCGIGLFLEGDKVAFMTGTGGDHDPATLHQTKPGAIKPMQWQHVAATWDGKTKRIFIDGEIVGDYLFSGSVRPADAPLRIGTYGQKGAALNFYNGDVAMCAIHDRALSAEQVRARVKTRGLEKPDEEHLVGCWPFSEERGKRVADASAHGREGRIINHGTWMIGGPSFDADSINRHDADYDPTQDPNRGHALRLASDDLYNARWKVNHRFQLPADSQSGVYAGRFDFQIDGKPKRYFTTFIVRRPEARPKAPLLVVVSSNTWLAYNSVPFPINHGPGLTNMGTGGLANSHPGAPKYSFYADHQAGQPTYKVGLKLPWPAAGPNKTYIGGGYSHLLRGERFLHIWLDQNGYEYDVITDRDLDRNPEVLKDYKAVALNGHSEYWSARAYDGVDRYLKNGGSALVMSGNTMFWRVSFDDSDEVMECRKFGSRIGGRKLAKVGEIYHSADFKRGSLMRFCGYPAWKLIGLECIGWGGGNFAHYQVEQPDHFLFNHPQKVELKKGAPFGFVSKNRGAVGHEYDVRLSTLLKTTPAPVMSQKELVEPEGIVTIASSRDQRNILDFNAEGHKASPGNESQKIAEIIYWERPQGGRVFHTGSIATAWGMYHDEALSNVVKNALHRFGVKPIGNKEVR